MPTKDSMEVRLELLDKSTGLVAESLMKMVAAIVDAKPSSVRKAKEDFAELIGQTMALADLIGRYRAILEVDSYDGNHQKFKLNTISPRRFARQKVAVFGNTPLFPRKAFREAFEELLERDPRLADSAEEIRKIYALGGFALQSLPAQLAERAREVLTGKVQKKIVELGASGVRSVDAKRVVANMIDSTEAYAETVYRTNLSTAFSDGRKKQMESPEAQNIAPAFEYTAVGDADTRPNHMAADGLIAPIDHAVWDRFSPPLGFNCRCDIRIVDRFELESRGLLRRDGRSKVKYPSGFNRAHPDRGFKN
jgi:SPP1 gp7 family putative phage head morphogenesis protein